MDKHIEEFLYIYLNNHSQTGFESSGQKILLDYSQVILGNIELFYARAK